MTDSRRLFEYLLRLGDSPLILAQRLGEWVGTGPMLEEDIALDQRRPRSSRPGAAVARLRRRGRGPVRGSGRNEDELAFLRDGREFRNLLLVEQPNGNFADTMARQFLFDAWHLLRCARCRARPIRASRRSPRRARRKSRITSSAPATG